MNKASNECLLREQVKELLDYNPETGEFIWKWRPREMFKTKRAWSTFNSHRANRPAGCLTLRKDGTLGYLSVGIFGTNYQIHRIAWLLMTGEWPRYQIDHINLVKHDNRWDNLRSATNFQNQHNVSLSKANKSGIKGVYWKKDVSKWAAYITANGGRYHLGVFDKIEDASVARKRAAEKYHGEFARVA